MAQPNSGRIGRSPMAVPRMSRMLSSISCSRATSAIRPVASLRLLQLAIVDFNHRAALLGLVARLHLKLRPTVEGGPRAPFEIEVGLRLERDSLLGRQLEVGLRLERHILLGLDVNLSM